MTDNLRFACTGCGKCCTGHHVPLTLDEARQWAASAGQVIVLNEAFLADGPGMPVEQREHVLRRSHPVHCGDGEARVSVTFAAFNPGRCRNLDDDNRCGIYEIRPLVCRIYPMEINPHIPLRPDAKELELVHRLDRDTSGLLMIAKKRSMLRHLHEALRGDGVDKRYMALVRGHWATAKKQVNAPLLKSNLRSGERMVEVNPEGKEALTIFRVLRRFGEFATLVEAKPVTGRTHQIRVHAQHAGHCIAGDSKYGDDDFTKEIRGLGGKRLFLHAYELVVPLPDGGQLKLAAPVETSSV